MGRWPVSLSSPVADSVFIHLFEIAPFEADASLKWMHQQSNLSQVLQKKKENNHQGLYYSFCYLHALVTFLKILNVMGIFRPPHSL